MHANDRYDSLFVYYGDEYEVDWKLLKAQVRAESNFDPYAKSPVGALGLSQFMPPTFSQFGHGDPTNPEEAIKAQSLYMAWLLDRFDDDVKLALASYNFGIGNVKKLRNLHGPDYEQIEPHLPNETRQYVGRISTFYTGYNG